MIKTLIAVTTSLLIALVLYPQGGNASPATKAQANQFFESCLSGTSASASVTPDAVMGVCACYSAGLLQSVSAEDLNSLAAPSLPPEAQTLKEKILADIYTPCAADVMADIIEQSCLGDPGIQELANTYNTAEICTCTGTQTAAWFKEKGTSLIADMLKRKTLTDYPLGALLDHGLLISNTKSNMVACTAVQP